MRTGIHGNDQRKHPRYELIDFALLETEEGEPYRCVVVDVSLAGLQVRSKVMLPVGAQCLLRIARLGQAPLTVAGEVRHSAPVEGTELFSSGFRLLPKDQAERVKIVDYVHGVFLRNQALAS